MPRTAGAPRALAREVPDGRSYLDWSVRRFSFHSMQRSQKLLVIPERWKDAIEQRSRWTVKYDANGRNHFGGWNACPLGISPIFRTASPIYRMEGRPKARREKTVEWFKLHSHTPAGIVNRPGPGRADKAMCRDQVTNDVNTQKHGNNRDQLQNAFHILVERPQSGIAACFRHGSCPRSGISRSHAESPEGTAICWTGLFGFIHW